MRTSQSTWNAKQGWSSTRAQPFAAADLVLAFGSSHAISDENLWNELQAQHPKATVLGCSTGGEIHGCDVVDESVSAMAFGFSDTGLAATEAEVDAAGGSFAVAETIGKRLARPDLAAIFVLSDGTRVNGSELVRGLRASVGENVILTGGLAGDGPNFGTTFVGLNAPPVPGKVAAIGFYGNSVRVGHGSCGGWDVFGPERQITQADANILHQLDGEPALDLYKRYLGEDAAGLPGSALLFPLRIYPADQPEKAVVRTVVGVDEAARTMIFAGDMPVGYRAQLMRGNFDRLIAGAANAAEQANVNHSGDRAAILVSCIGRKLLLGQRIREEVEAVQDVFGSDVPLAGFYSYGEVSPHQATGYAELHNQTMTITVLSES